MRVARRLLAIANALSGMSREAAARSAGMDRQTLRDWVIRYNADGIEGHADRWGDGRPPRLDADQQAERGGISRNQRAGMPHTEALPNPLLRCV